MEIEKLQELVVQFRDARDWKQFNNPKDCALSLVLEATEVLEHFQWKNGEVLEEYVKKEGGSIGEELADMLYWVLLMSHDLDVDISEVFQQKLLANDKKYPIEKAKGRSKKYDRL